MLDKTTSTVERLETNLFLMNCKFSEFNDLLPFLKDLANNLQTDPEKRKTL